MRRNVLTLAAVVFCFALEGLAQAPHPHGGPPLVDLLLPHNHPKPAPANAPRTPEVIFDASNLGSPMILDKGWRVGITANPAAANPNFDDSTWAVREAKDGFADVPDEDHPEIRWTRTRIQIPNTRNTIPATTRNPLSGFACTLSSRPTMARWHC